MTAPRPKGTRLSAQNLVIRGRTLRSALNLYARYVTAQNHKSDVSMRGCIHVRCAVTGRALGVPHPLQRVSPLWHQQF